MQLRTLLGGFLTSVLYPMWLVAGAGDYLCHRRTHIERTSGITESWLHIAQFASIAVIFIAAVVLEVTLAVLIAMIIAAIAHTVLSFIDVSYTMRHRHISTLEQHVHGLLDVIPIVAVGLLAILYWEEIALANGAPLRLKDEPLSNVEVGVLLGSFGVLAGIPIFEEWFRSRRSESTSA